MEISPPVMHNGSAVWNVFLQALECKMCTRVYGNAWFFDAGARLFCPSQDLWFLQQQRQQQHQTARSDEAKTRELYISNLVAVDL